ncbi:hypothetical protein [Ideonella sp.]|jgi:hypothetical protein|uniref:hypothetical protein n=1 Tax=Ideonella sp. TaxID=1929293 RepID=UPI0037BE7179
MRWLVLSLVTVLLSACATPNIQPGHVLDQKSGKGIAAGTITYQGGYGAYRVHIEEKSGRERYQVQHGESQTMNLSYVFKGEPLDADLKQKGSAFAIELPAGTYIIRSWQISQGAGNVWSTKPTGIEFSVAAGQSVYLGSFHFVEKAKVGKLTTAAEVTLSENAGRDIPFLKSKFPVLATNPISQAIAEGTKVESLGGASDGRIQIPIFVPIVR